MVSLSGNENYYLLGVAPGQNYEQMYYMGKAHWYMNCYAWNDDTIQDSCIVGARIGHTHSARWLGDMRRRSDILPRVLHSRVMAYGGAETHNMNVKVYQNMKDSQFLYSTRSPPEYAPDQGTIPVSNKSVYQPPYSVSPYPDNSYLMEGESLDNQKWYDVEPMQDWVLTPGQVFEWKGTFDPNGTDPGWQCVRVWLSGDIVRNARLAPIENKEFSLI
jgi:hypothetical protein